MKEILMDNATQQLVYELMKIALSAAGIVLSYYVKSWLSTNTKAKKYAEDLGITERTIDNAIDYAEKEGLKIGVKGIAKRNIALRYLDKIDPSLITKYAGKLELMIDRKVAQKFK